MYLWDLCVSASVNKQVVDLSEELARKVEDSLRQQEEISSLLAQIVDLQARCKGVREKHSHKFSSQGALEEYVQNSFWLYQLCLLSNVCMFSTNGLMSRQKKNSSNFLSVPLAHQWEWGAEPKPECLPWEPAKTEIRGKTKYTRLELAQDPVTFLLELCFVFLSKWLQSDCGHVKHAFVFCIQNYFQL